MFTEAASLCCVSRGQVNNKRWRTLHSGRCGRYVTLSCPWHSVHYPGTLVTSMKRFQHICFAYPESTHSVRPAEVNFLQCPSMRGHEYLFQEQQHRTRGQYHPCRWWRDVWQVSKVTKRQKNSSVNNRWGRQACVYAFEVIAIGLAKLDFGSDRFFDRSNVSNCSCFRGWWNKACYLGSLWKLHIVLNER